MPNDDTHDIAPKAAPLRWLSKFNHGFNIVTGLSAFTVLSSLAVGYFQYLNAYQEKVSSQAKEDMAGGDHRVHGDLTRILRSAGPAANPVFRFHPRRRRQIGRKRPGACHQERARDFRALRKGADRTARKYRRADAKGRSLYRLGERHAIAIRPTSIMSMTDPLSRQVLRDYAFDCSDKFNFPAFGNVDTPRTTTRRTKQIADNEYCAIAEKRGVDETTKPKDAFIRICAGPNDKARQANLLVQRQAPRPDDALLLRGHAQQAGGRAAMGLPERPGRREGKGNRRARERRSTSNWMIWPGGSTRSAAWRCIRWSKSG